MRSLWSGAVMAVICAAGSSANASTPDGGTAVFETRTVFDGGSSVTFKICDTPNCGAPSVLDRLHNVSPNLAVDERGAPEPPKVKPEVTKDGTALRLVVGQTKFVRLPCVPTRFAFGNNPWDLRYAGGDLILLEGYQTGRGVLRGWCEGGRQLSYPVDVRP